VTITILLPSKNPTPLFFNEALQSLFEQSSDDWRLIVIGDSETGRLLETARRDPRIHLIPNTAPRISGALNAGMREAKTAFVCALHNDDRLCGAAIETLHRYLAEYPADFYYASRRIIDEHGEAVTPVLLAPAQLQCSDFIHTSIKNLMCWDVGKALAIGGVDEELGLHGADDYDFPWSMLENGCRFQAISECLYEYRDHRESYRLTTHVPLDAQIADLAKILRKHGVSEDAIDRQIKIRSSGYLRQALFLDDSDREQKERSNFDIRSGWKERYP